MDKHTGSVKRSLTLHSNDTENSIDKQDVGYTNRIFVQALFPYKELDEKIRTIHNGNQQISVMSPNGIPYGKYPRLIMALINTLAVENAGKAEAGIISHDEARKIYLGRSMNTFLTTLGLETRGSGGSTGTLTRLREQLLRLASSAISVQSRTSKRVVGANAQIVKSWDLWFDPANPDQLSFSDSYLELTPEFYEQICANPIPVDLTVLTKLSRPRAMDLYLWITVKKYRVWKTNQPQELFSWENLASSLTIKQPENAKELAMFRREIKKSLNQIEQLWPELDCEATTEGLVIKKGPLPISPRGSRKLMPHK